MGNTKGLLKGVLSRSVDDSKTPGEPGPSGAKSKSSDTIEALDLAATGAPSNPLSKEEWDKLGADASEKLQKERDKMREEVTEARKPDAEALPEEWKPVDNAANAVAEFLDKKPFLSSTLSDASKAMAQLRDAVKQARHAIAARLEESAKSLRDQLKPCREAIPNTQKEEASSLEEACELVEKTLSSGPLKQTLLEKARLALKAAEDLRTEILANVLARLDLKAQLDGCKSAIESAMKSLKDNPYFGEYKKANEKEYQQVADLCQPMINEVKELLKKWKEYDPKLVQKHIGTTAKYRKTILDAIGEYSSKLDKFGLEEDELKAQEDRVKEIKEAAESLLDDVDEKKEKNKCQKRESGQKALLEAVKRYKDLSRADRLKNSDRDKSTVAWMNNRLNLATESASPEAAELKKKEEAKVALEKQQLLANANAGWTNMLQSFASMPSSMSKKAREQKIKDERGINNNYEYKSSQLMWAHLLDCQKRGKKIGAFSVSGSETAGLSLHRPLPEAYAFDNILSFVYHVWKQS